MRRLLTTALLVLAAAPAFAQAKKEPIALRDMGSFHIGGRIIEITGQPVKEVVFTPGGVPALEEAVRSYVRSGDVSLLAAARLLVVAALAEHHLDHGRTARAVSALERFTAIAGHPWPGRVSGEARAALIHQAGSLLAQLT